MLYPLRKIKVDPDQMVSNKASQLISIDIGFSMNMMKHLNHDGDLTSLQIRVCIGKLFSLFLIQYICCGNSKEPSQ